MKILRSWLVWLPTVLIIFSFVYFFPQVLIYILIALVLSFMGNPIVRWLDKLHFKKFHLPHSLNALIALLVVVGVFVFLAWIIIPFLLGQLSFLINFDYEKLLSYYQPQIDEWQNLLRKYNLIGDNQTFQSMLETQIQKFIGMFNLEKFFSNIVSFIGNAFIFIFSVLFIAYYFLKEDKLFYRGVTLITPPHSHDELARIFFYAKKMLSRYFIGLAIEQVIMMGLISLGMYIIGIKNFFLIGFLYGIFNIIPYVGPFIGGFFGILIGLASLPIEQLNILAVPLIIKMLVVYFICKMIDDFILQPNIYGRSVKAHPLEIFLIILIAGYVGGPLGMVLAVPGYTLFRIVAVELFNNWTFINNLFKNFSQQLEDQNKK